MKYFLVTWTMQHKKITKCFFLLQYIFQNSHPRAYRLGEIAAKGDFEKVITLTLGRLFKVACTNPSNLREPQPVQCNFKSTRSPQMDMKRATEESLMIHITEW